MTQLDATRPGLAPRAAFIAAMRGVASSVTVVTTSGSAGRHGATVSAFCSVSADPPSVLVCLKADSRIARCVSANQTFCVNVLPQPREDIAQRFAGCHDTDVADRFDGVEGVVHEAVNKGGPAFAGATTFSCILEKTVDFGSHRIFIGHVVQVREGSPAPLAYLNGAYHRVVPQSPAALSGPDLRPTAPDAAQ